MMDLDNDVDVNRLEVASWLTRNINIICRPFRHSILADLREKTLNYYHPLFLFLDADGNKVINKTDVSALVKDLDTNYDKKVSKGAFLAATGQMFAEICKAEAKNDRQNFLAKSKTKTSSKQGLFQLMDTDNDGQLTRKEITYVYRMIDTNRDIKDSHAEVVAYVRENLDTICASQRNKIVGAIKKQERQAKLNSGTLTKVYRKFSGNKPKKVNLKGKRDSYVMQCKVTSRVFQ